MFKYCDEACFKSKNLYNYANYLIRQEFLNNNRIISAFELNKMLKTHKTFKALPAKTSQQIIIQLCYNWKSFFKAIKQWKKNKNEFCGKPNLPKYKKKNGRNIVYFDYMQGSFQDGKYYFPVKGGNKSVKNEYIETNITKEQFKQLRIVPYGSCYKIEIVYEVEVPDTKETNNKYLAIDLGVDNLATLTNNIGLRPIVINGRILKSINNYYNKIRAKAQSYIGVGTSKRIQRIDFKRNNIVNTHMHKISRWIINYCLDNNIQNIIIGKNHDWKHSSKMNNVSNQRFIQIPFENLINKIKYKAEEKGIKVIMVDEKYTSQASFIDNDDLPDNINKYEFSGRRIYRGLYKSKGGILINADVNGSYNILRKGNPEFKYDDRIKGVSLHPIRLNIA